MEFALTLLGGNQRSLEGKLSLEQPACWPPPSLSSNWLAAVEWLECRGRDVEMFEGKTLVFLALPGSVLEPLAEERLRASWEENTELAFFRGCPLVVEPPGVFKLLKYVSLYFPTCPF